MKRLRLFSIMMLIPIGVLLMASYYLWQKDRTVQLVLSAGQKGGTYKPLAESIAQVVNASYPEIEISVIESHGSTENIRRLTDGDADLALLQNDTPGNASIRALVPLHWEVLHFLVRRDADIHKVQDISGHTVEVGPRDSGTEVLARHLLRHYGLSYDNFKPVYFEISAAADKILTGEIDALLVIQGLTSSACQKIMTSGKVRFVGLGKSGTEGGETEGFCLKYPFVTPYVIPVYSYTTINKEHPGEPRQPIATIAVRSLLVSHKNVPDDVARKITQAIFDNRLTLIRAHVAAAQIIERFDASLLQYSIHPGARSFYNRDKPSFLETYAEAMGFLLSAFIALAGLFIAVRRWLMLKKKNLIDDYYLRLDEYMSKIKVPDVSESELNKMDSELSEMHHHALHKLVNEKLLADESFSIFQSLLSECQRQVQFKLTGYLQKD